MQAEDLIATIRRHKKRYLRHIDQLVRVIHERDIRIDALQKQIPSTATAQEIELLKSELMCRDQVIKGYREQIGQLQRNIDALESQNTLSNRLIASYVSEINRNHAQLENQAETIREFQEQPVPLATNDQIFALRQDLDRMRKTIEDSLDKMNDVHDDLFSTLAQETNK
jgi:predicted  nucleic acid-binding Zn-ribbon protein